MTCKRIFFNKFKFITHVRKVSLIKEKHTILSMSMANKLHIKGFLFTPRITKTSAINSNSGNTRPQQKHTVITSILATPYILVTRYGFQTAITHTQNIKSFIMGRTSPNL